MSRGSCFFCHIECQEHWNWNPPGVEVSKLIKSKSVNFPMFFFDVHFSQLIALHARNRGKSCHKRNAETAH